MQNLKRILQHIDGKGYKSYKDIKGVYEFDQFSLIIDHVQGDPFALPSRISVRVPMSGAGFPLHSWSDNTNNPVRRIALEDYLGRMVKKISITSVKAIVAVVAAASLTLRPMDKNLYYAMPY